MEHVAFPTLGAIAKKTILRADLSMSVNEAAKLMNEKGLSSIVFEQGQDRFIFSVEDLLRFVHAEGNGRQALRELYVPTLYCMNESQRVLAALEYLEQRGLRYLGVTNEDNTLVGIISYSDILTSIDPVVLMERKSIGDLISRSAPVTFTADWILEDVVHHLKKMEDSIVVVEEGKPIGIVTTTDVFGVLASGREMLSPLAHYMTSPVFTMPDHSSISDALLQLKMHAIKRIVVVDEKGKLVGVATQSELVGFAYGSWVNILRSHTAELHELVGMLQEKTRNLEMLTVTDTLTGLGNRRLLHKHMMEEIERMRRYGSAPFSLVIVDIDLFKSVNDQFGHLVGDEVLKAIAAEIDHLVRKTDTAVRWGGEEFAVLLSNTPLAAAAALTDRLRGIIEQLSFADGAKVTISAGVGEFVSKEDEATFFQRVDRALYTAKANGRNQVKVDLGW
ncbi:MAG: diguanylate cyclase [Sideroxydans sp.]|nr:diguanylate cyclase [Sideroxydans sp.]